MCIDGRLGAALPDHRLPSECHLDGAGRIKSPAGLPADGSERGAAKEPRSRTSRAPGSPTVGRQT